MWQNPEFRMNHAVSMMHANTDPEHKARRRDIGKRNWEDPGYREKVLEARTRAARTPEARAATSDVFKRLWQNPGFRAKQSEASKRAQGTPNARAKRSEITKRLWQKPEFRAKASEGNRLRLERDKKTKEKAIPAEVRNQLLNKIRLWCSEQVGRLAKLSRELGVTHSSVTYWLTGLNTPTIKNWLTLQEFARKIEAGEESCDL